MGCCSPFPFTGSLYPLPARLCHARNHSSGSKLTEGNTRHLEATQIGATTSSNHATINEASWTRIARKHGKTNIIFLFLQLVTEICVTGDSLHLAVISSFPALSCHGGGGNNVFGGLFKRILWKNEIFEQIYPLKSFECPPKRPRFSAVERLKIEALSPTNDGNPLESVFRMALEESESL